MAGIPSKVVHRADEILKQLELTRQNQGKPNVKKSDQENMQLSFFQLNDPVLEQIKEQIQKTDINNLTPVEALNRLSENQETGIGGK